MVAAAAPQPAPPTTAPAAAATTAPAATETAGGGGHRFSLHGLIPQIHHGGQAASAPAAPPSASDQAFAGTDQPKTLGALLAKNHATIDQIKAQSWMLQSYAQQLLVAKGVASPTQSQLDDTTYKMSAAIDAGTWQSFEAPFNAQVIKTEDNVNQRLGNVFFEKHVFAPQELDTQALKLQPYEEQKLHGDYESGAAGMIYAASFINTSSRSEGDFSHAYGDDAWRGFVRAEAYLDAIPKGQFLQQLSVDTLLEVNRLIHAPDLGMKAKMLRTIAMIGRGGRWDVGGELRTGRQFARPETYSKNEMDNLREAGVHVSQLTHHGDGGGKAMLEYPKPEEVRPGLERIIAELKTDMAAPNADPVMAASKFQRHFVALHPFGDSNGRTSRILMNRILAEADMSPAILEDQNRDVSKSPEEWRTEVAKGVARSKLFIEQRQVGSKDQYLGQWNIKAVPQSPDKPVTLNGLPFDLGSDGFLYDPTGRPWIVENNEVIPLGQMEHYMLARRVMQESTTPGHPEQPTTDLKTITASTVALYQKVAADPEAGKNIVVRDDTTARQSDAKYKLSPSPEMAQILTQYSDVAKLEPTQLLQISGTIGMSQVMSKYAQIDLDLWYIEKGLREGGFNDKVAELHAHRAAFFDVAKKEMAKYADASRVSPENPQGFHWRYEKMMYDTSPLRFASLDAAIKADGDGKITVWRGDYSFARVIGMAPNNDIRQPDAKAIAKDRDKHRQLTNLYDDLTKLEGSAVGRQYISTTSDLELLTAAFANTTNSQQVNLHSLPKGVRDYFLAWLQPDDKVDPTKQAEAHKKGLDAHKSILPAEGAGTEIRDAFGIPGTILTISVVDRNAGTLQVSAPRKAFEIEANKDDFLPGIYALNGPSFENEQEMHALSRINPWQIKSTHTAESLTEEFPVKTAPQPQPAAPATTPTTSS